MTALWSPIAYAGPAIRYLRVWLTRATRPQRRCVPPHPLHRGQVLTGARLSPFHGLGGDDHARRLSRDDEGVDLVHHVGEPGRTLAPQLVAEAVEGLARGRPPRASLLKCQSPRHATNRTRVH